MHNMQLAHLKSILLVDADDASRVATKWFLDSFGFEVHTARNGEEALAVFDHHIHDVIITDNMLPGMTGQELAHIIKLRSPLTPVIMYTEESPGDCNCLDKLIMKPTHLMFLQAAAEDLIASRPHFGFNGGQ